MVESHSGRVLVIEDDRYIAEFVNQGLTEAGFEVHVSHDGMDGFDRAVGGVYSVIILDIMLPGQDGLSLLRLLRERNITTPVLILSAKRSVNDRVQGLRVGGDDYLVKPFVFAELLARIESLLRRVRGSHEPMRLQAADLILDLITRRVYRDQEEIDLQPQEFRLLEYLMRNRGQVVTRTQILQHVWGYNFSPATNVVEVHICRLRDKIERPEKGKLLSTVRGAGYVLVADDQVFS